MKRAKRTHNGISVGLVNAKEVNLLDNFRNLKASEQGAFMMFLEEVAAKADFSSATERLFIAWGSSEAEAKVKTVEFMADHPGLLSKQKVGSPGVLSAA
jgi:hypothetical protein